MDIQYVAHVNTTVIRDAVNAVGGITVNVDSRDPRGVLDASVNWMCSAGNPTPEERQRRCPQGNYIDFPNGPNDMDGEKALWFSRARGAIPGYATYGLEESNFDREKNQQLILMALKDKATSTGTLMDVSKMLSLMEAMGNNLRTNVDTKEVRTILKIASEMNNEDMHQLSFVEEDNLLMVTGNQAGQSIVQPAAGLYNYRDIRTFIKQTIYATPVSKEGATVAVLNGGNTAGAAQEQADRLEQLGMNVVYTGNTPESNFTGYTVHAAGAVETNPATREKLAGLYGVSLTQGSPSFGLSVEADFVVIVGNSGS